MAPSLDTDTRVADYLDDKLQTLADLDSLDELLANVRSQQGLLKQQLSEAERDLGSAKQAARDRAAEVRRRARDFDAQQRDIDEHLRLLTGSDASDDALGRFEASMGALRRLDVANAYVRLLEEVDRLSAQATAALSRSPDDDNNNNATALPPYRRLRLLLAQLRPLHAAAEGAAPHLLDHVARTAADLRSRIAAAYSAELEAALHKLGWPRPDAVLAGSLLSGFNHAFRKLLSLQIAELEADGERSSSSAGATAGGGSRELVLLPMETLVKPLALRFRYHFSGARPTNRLDRPEYFLAHATGLLAEYAPFARDYVQPLLSAAFASGSGSGAAPAWLARNPLCVDATSALVAALLPVVRWKVLKEMPRVVEEPGLLGHWVVELMRFDGEVRGEWGFEGGAVGDGGGGEEGGGEEQGWEGLGYEVLVQKGYVEQWLQGETAFAVARYQEIVEAADGGELEYESVEAGQTKPSKAAIRLVDLLETITEHYRPLPSPPHQLRFLIHLQLDLTDRFLRRLDAALEAYRTMTSPLSRIPGGSIVVAGPEDRAAVAGIHGLDRVCRILGSADYVARALGGWADDVFFAGLWSEAKRMVARAVERAGPDAAVAGTGLGARELAHRTSDALLPADGARKAAGAAEPEPEPDVDVDDMAASLFDAQRACFERLRGRAERSLHETLRLGVGEALRPYAGVTDWASLAWPATAPAGSSAGAGGSLQASPQLAPALTHLGHSLGFLGRALAAPARRRAARAAARAAADALFDGVLLRNRFAEPGAAQLGVDVGALEGVLEREGGQGVGAAGLRRVREGVGVLRAVGVRGRDGGGRERGERLGVLEEGDLWEMERRLFRDNVSARELLEEMGVEALTVKEARRNYTVERVGSASGGDAHPQVPSQAPTKAKSLGAGYWVPVYTVPSCRLGGHQLTERAGGVGTGSFQPCGLAGVGTAERGRLGREPGTCELNIFGQPYAVRRWVRLRFDGGNSEEGGVGSLWFDCARWRVVMSTHFDGAPSACRSTYDRGWHVEARPRRRRPFWNAGGKAGKRSGGTADTHSWHVVRGSRYASHGLVLDSRYVRPAARRWAFTRQSSPSSGRRPSRWSRRMAVGAVAGDRAGGAAKDDGRRVDDWPSVALFRLPKPDLVRIPLVTQDLGGALGHAQRPDCSRPALPLPPPRLSFAWTKDGSWAPIDPSDASIEPTPRPGWLRSDEDEAEMETHTGC
ncbi:TIP-1 family-domain-containing protein [Lineolata rhizophorae]|uniref:TIP-1 family-domain-containing protein n=1 Tax=Lineolata rhizophorae TaxID=578093 RepID=A0A6A6P740_9PEZI|nr:TIP-1 family-domain-containing protein [Lineolata rhizophorae]